jgi:hypothetical protein
MRHLRNLTFGIIGLGVVGITAARGVAQGAPDTAGTSAAVAFAERTVIRTLRFTAGDAASMKVARATFSDSAWANYWKQYQGFVDSPGARHSSAPSSRRWVPRSSSVSQTARST